MNLDKNILRIISKYLDRGETGEERKKLYQWYDNLSTGKPLSKKAAAKLYNKGIDRLSAEIENLGVQRIVKRPVWYPAVAAAAVIVLLGYFAFEQFKAKDTLVPVKLADLEKIIPVSDKVIITLSTGKMVDPDTLSIGRSVRLGNSIVQKDSLGHLLYRTAGEGISSELISSVQTPKATQYTIELSDGTKVFLNAKSRLSFPEQFGSGDRIVQLSGEAYFEVTKTLAHSKFIVKTDRQSIQVLGTKFNVNAYGGAAVIKTTLAEGSVSITPTDKSIKPLIIKPDQQAILDQQGIASMEVDARQIIAWKDGYFIFDGSNTQEVIQEISQWYGISVEDKIGNRSITYAGKIPKNISMARLIELLSYADINIRAFKDKNDQIKLIVN